MFIHSKEKISEELNEENRHSSSASQTPIDRLIFLKNRISKSKFGLSSGILLSSEAGFIQFWSFYAQNLDLGKCFEENAKKHLMLLIFISKGGFYAPMYSGQSVLCLATDTFNNILITGDTKGIIQIWNIKTYLLDPSIPVVI